jgi:phospholipid/cholesterol/gamma-HCH transport system substrate-binding protein
VFPGIRKLSSIWKRNYDRAGNNNYHGNRVPDTMNETKRQGHYLHTVTYTVRERLVGAFVLTAVLGFLVLMAINITASHVFEEKVVFHAYLNDGKGLNTDTAVKVSGIEAGRVLSLNITENNKVHAEIFVYKRFHERIRSNALATLNRLSMLGVASIDISPGTTDSPVLAEGATIGIRERLSMDQMLEGLAELLYQSDAVGHASVFANLAEAAENLKMITGRIREGKGAAGVLLYDKEFNNKMVSTVDSLHELLATAASRLDQMEPVLQESSELMTSLHNASSDVPALVSEVRDSVREANRVLLILGRETEALPDFMVRVDLLLRDTAEVIDALERIWPVSSALEQPEDDALIEPQVAHD